MLARWVGYYGSLIGRENLYVLRQGHNPQVDQIAAGANILHQPDQADVSADRRWSTLSHFTSGLTLYYNWVLCCAVDEIVTPDPAQGVALPDYLDALFATGQAPMTVAAQPLGAGGQASGMARPCITRKRVALSQDGPLRAPLPGLFVVRHADLAGETAGSWPHGPASGGRQ